MTVVRWVLLVLFVVIGLTYLGWFMQEISFYSADPRGEMAQHYQSRAISMLPVSILFISSGALWFYVLRGRGK